MLYEAEKNDVINISIKSSDDIFQSFGIIPFGESMLNREFECYIFNMIKKYSVRKKLKLVFQIPLGEKNLDLLQGTIHTHFKYKAKESDMLLKLQFKNWVINMIIGILFLVLCLILVGILEVFSYISLIKIMKESLLIIGWVALWEPLTFILFGWRAAKREKLYYEKLSNIPVFIVKY
jgi:hypothetical protein